MRRALAALTAAVATAVALLLSGCAVEDVTDTQSSSDGLRAELGPLLLSNLMVLSAGEGRPGVVLGAVANHGEDTVTVAIGLEGKEPAGTFELSAGETVLLGPEEHQVRLEDMPQPPGAVTTLRIVSDDGELTRRVPVLDATLEYYEGLVPSPTSS